MGASEQREDMRVAETELAKPEAAEEVARGLPGIAERTRRRSVSARENK